MHGAMYPGVWFEVIADVVCPSIRDGQVVVFTACSYSCWQTKVLCVCRLGVHGPRGLAQA